MLHVQKNLNNMPPKKSSSKRQEVIRIDEEEDTPRRTQRENVEDGYMTPTSQGYANTGKRKDRSPMSQGTKDVFSPVTKKRMYIFVKKLLIRSEKASPSPSTSPSEGLQDEFEWLSLDLHEGEKTEESALRMDLTMSVKKWLTFGSTWGKQPFFAEFMQEFDAKLKLHQNTSPVPGGRGTWIKNVERIHEHVSNSTYYYYDTL